MEQQFQQQNQVKKDKKSSLLIILLLLLVSITIGYAVLSTTLNINGSSTIVNADWCVGPKCAKDGVTGDPVCENIETCQNSPIVCPANTVCTIMDCDVNGSSAKCQNPPAPDTCSDISKAGQADCKGAVIWMKGDTIYFKHILEKPGDVFTFNVTFANGGNLDAKVNDVTKSALNATAQDYMTYDVTYSDGSAIEQNDTLTAGSSATFKVTVTYKPTVTNLPDDATLNLINEVAQGHTGATSLFTVNYGQK